MGVEWNQNTVEMETDHFQMPNKMETDLNGNRKIVKKFLKVQYYTISIQIFIIHLSPEVLRKLL